MTEGIIDHLRSVEGGLIAAVVRDQGSRGRSARKVSLRVHHRRSRRLGDRTQPGGGGEEAISAPPASLPISPREEIISFLCDEVGSQAKS